MVASCPINSMVCLLCVVKQQHPALQPHKKIRTCENEGHKMQRWKTNHLHYLQKWHLPHKFHLYLISYSNFQNFYSLTVFCPNGEAPRSSHKLGEFQLWLFPKIIYCVGVYNLRSKNYKIHKLEIHVTEGLALCKKI